MNNANSKTRTVTVYYEDAAGEHPLEVEVGRDGRHAVVETDLSDIPESERAGVICWACDLYWKAERSAYLRSAECERDGQ